MRTIQEFAHDLVQRYSGQMDPASAQMIAEDCAAGEFEVAAISVIEDAPVSASDVDELERLAADFDAVDRDIATRVIAKRRKQFAA